MRNGGSLGRSCRGLTALLVWFSVAFLRFFAASSRKVSKFSFSVPSLITFYFSHRTTSIIIIASKGSARDLFVFLPDLEDLEKFDNGHFIGVSLGSRVPFVLSVYLYRLRQHFLDCIPMCASGSVRRGRLYTASARMRWSMLTSLASATSDDAQGSCSSEAVGFEQLYLTGSWLRGDHQASTALIGMPQRLLDPGAMNAATLFSILSWSNTTPSQYRQLHQYPHRLEVSLSFWYIASSSALQVWI